MAKEIEISPRTPDNGKHHYCFKCFNITDADVVLGLRHIKAKVKHEFKNLAKRYHPDTGNGYKRKYGQQITTASQFKELVRMRKRLLDMKVMPLTMDNLEIVLEITKGYVSSRDYNMPFEVNI